MQAPKAYAGPSVPVRVSFVALFAAWVKTRRGKQPSANHLAFASRWLDALQTLHQQLRAGTWMPRRTVSFVVKHPKTREIHAPDFADRVVHHWLVGQLEALYEPVFIHDSFANRRGKGSHAAVDRLQSFVRQRNGRGWFLKLDVHNFFYSIHRPTLYALIKQRITKNTRTSTSASSTGRAHASKDELPVTTIMGKHKLRASHATALLSLCHKLLAQPQLDHCVDPVAASALPLHKRLRNAALGCGLPIGNLTSQFFANVYLNELDQFVKHHLKVRHYVRYVDDFVLLAEDDATLKKWHEQIVAFMRDRLRLRLRDDYHMATMDRGIDFLGYVVFPSYRLVRQRVITHCESQLALWAQRHVKVSQGVVFIHANTEQLQCLQNWVASYWGHFAHANSFRLRHRLLTRYSWLHFLFSVNSSAQLTPRWVLQGATWAQQLDWLRAQWPHAVCEIQRGFEMQHFMPEFHGDGSRVRAIQTGYLPHGTRKREITFWKMMQTGACAGTARV